MKIAPIIRASRGRLEYRLIHTGQHYDSYMSDDLFSQLGIPPPDVNLEVGSGTQAEQTAAIMVGYEKVLLERPSRICMVVGDVNSTMACAITARKLGIPVAHVEAGIRSGDLTMPEEINRIVTDSISNYFFTTRDGEWESQAYGCKRGTDFLRWQHHDRHAAGKHGTSAASRVLERAWPGARRLFRGDLAPAD
jgi:UDP-N-acetylglucosamine 2-epimerase